MFLKFFAAFLSLLVLAAPLARAADSGVQALDAAWIKSMKANDLEGLVKLYAADAVAWLPMSPEAKGEAAIRATYKGLLDANTVKDAALMNTTYRTSGDRSVGWGQFKVTLAPKAGGDAIVMTGRFLEVAEKRNGKWAYVADHASPEPQPEPPRKAPEPAKKAADAPKK